MAFIGRHKSVDGDRTLVSWFCFDEDTPNHCSVLTIQAGDAYDAIAFGEQIPGKWSVASEDNKRTQQESEQIGNASEEVVPGQFIQMAVVYQGNNVTIYRNGEVYTSYDVENTVDLLSSYYLKAAIGPVKLIDGTAKCFKGKVDDARIYAHALTQEQIKKLQPNVASEISSFAWWNFEHNELRDLCGAFPETRPAFETKVEDGKLVLGMENSYMWTPDSMAIRVARDLREKLMEDPTRPTYHLINSEGDNDRQYPTDPNMSIFWKGRYHISYMYDGVEKGWGHFSSVDMVHWRRERTDCPPAGSGGVYVNKKGEVTFVDGSGLTMSSDDNLEKWSKRIPIDWKARPGQETDYVTTWDPTGWYEKETNTYYTMFGGKVPSLVRSKDQKNWELVGRFMTKNMPDVHEDEDYSCSDIFKLGDKYMWLLISHNYGCRYYLGKWENEQFTPDFHARMNWDTFRISTLFPAPQFFAPTTLLTPDERRIMFAWLPGGGNTMWSGTFSLPRELSLPEDGILRIRPIRELECLRYNETVENSINVKAGADYRLDKISGDTLELNITIKPTEAKKYGARVLCDENNKGLNIFYSADERTISIGDGLPPLSRTRSKPYTVAPFELRKGEDLKLRIFIDKPIVEAFINDRQAVYRRHPHKPGDVAVSLFSEDGDIEANVTSWKMAASNQW